MASVAANSAMDLVHPRRSCWLAPYGTLEVSLVRKLADKVLCVLTAYAIWVAIFTIAILIAEMG